MKRRTFIKYATISSIPATISGCNSINQNNDNNTNPDSGQESYDLIETPSYDISRPPVSNWNPDYLGENLEESGEFRQLNDYNIKTKQLDISERNDSLEFYADLITSENQNEQITIDEQIDYTEQSLVIIESGYVSEDWSHQWGSLEQFNDMYRLRGYYRIPEPDRSRLSSIHSAVLIPNDSEIVVSLTINPDTVVNFSTDSNVVGYSIS